MPPAFLMPLSSASARVRMWPYIEYWCGVDVSIGVVSIEWCYHGKDSRRRSRSWPSCQLCPRVFTVCSVYCELEWLIQLSSSVLSLEMIRQKAENP